MLDTPFSPWPCFTRKAVAKYHLTSVVPVAPFSRTKVASRPVKWPDRSGVAVISRVMRLEPGDLVLTGTPEGVAPLAAAGLRDSLAGLDLLTAGSWPDLPWPLRIAIDHCWHDPALVAVERAVGPALGSDHRPLQVALAWAP